MDIRPRTTGEILDDAWRLALADAPPLLALSGLFLTPAAVVLLLLLAQRPTENAERFVLPGLFALVVPLTGLGSGACQALFRRRAEGERVTLLGCIGEALRHGLDHVAVRGLVIMFVMLGSLLMVLPGLALWIATATVHPIIAAGRGRWLPALGAAGQESQRQPAKAVGVVLSRLFLLLVAVLNLHLFVQVFLWIGDSFAGLDLALLDFVTTPSNPVYDVTLMLAAWLLHAPFAEASNYLLHVDARARYEGLDLWYRVRRLFPTGTKRATTAALLAIGVLFGTALPATAADPRLAVVQEARKEVQRISGEVKAAEPYPGSGRWTDALETVGERLDRDGSRQPGRFVWFTQTVPAFRKADRAGAQRILAELDRRLALIEDSLTPPESSGNALSKEQLKALLPDVPEEAKTEQKNKPKEKEPEKPKEEPVRQADPAHEAPPRVRHGSGVVGPQQGGGFGSSTWLVLAVVAAAVILLALLLSRRERVAAAPKPAEVKKTADPLALESLLAQPAKALDSLWHQADELARAGKCLDAVRTLYLAVLMLLHRSNLIRCAPMRTNGEYVRQVRERDELYRPFRGLTGLFEVKWYGERSCAPEDYATCRRLAENIREGVKAGS